MKKRMLMIMMSVSMAAPAVLGNAFAAQVESAHAPIFQNGARECDLREAPAKPNKVATKSSKAKEALPTGSKTIK
jgi:hypothetical protein